MYVCVYMVKNKYYIVWLILYFPHLVELVNLRAKGSNTTATIFSPRLLDTRGCMLASATAILASAHTELPTVYIGRVLMYCTRVWLTRPHHNPPIYQTRLSQPPEGFTGSIFLCVLLLLPPPNMPDRDNTTHSQTPLSEHPTPGNNRSLLEDDALSPRVTLMTLGAKAPSVDNGIDANSSLFAPAGAFSTQELANNSSHSHLKNFLSPQITVAVFS